MAAGKTELMGQRVRLICNQASSTAHKDAEPFTGTMTAHTCVHYHKRMLFTDLKERLEELRLDAHQRRWILHNIKIVRPQSTMQR